MTLSELVSRLPIEESIYKQLLKDIKLLKEEYIIYYCLQTGYCLSSKKRNTKNSHKALSELAHLQFIMKNIPEQELCNINSALLLAFRSLFSHAANTRNIKIPEEDFVYILQKLYPYIEDINTIKENVRMLINNILEEGIEVGKASQIIKKTFVTKQKDMKGQNELNPRLIYAIIVSLVISISKMLYDSSYITQ